MPKQDQLLSEFGVSRPSLRAALRILETEGLVTVKRGQVGGAVVHPPRPEGIAYFLALLLQASTVDLSDVAKALHELEPICASLCAVDSRRHPKIVRRLRAAHEDAKQVVDSAEDFTHAARKFHEEIVACCPNETLRVMVGSIVTVWSAHEGEWAHLGSGRGGRFPSRRLRYAGLEAHERILDAIERGDGQEAAAAYGKHLDEAQSTALRHARHEVVSARVTRQYRVDMLRDLREESR